MISHPFCFPSSGGCLGRKGDSVVKGWGAWISYFASTFVIWEKSQISLWLFHMYDKTPLCLSLFLPNKTGDSITRNMFSWTTLAKGLNLSIWVTKHLFKLLQEVSQNSRSGLLLAGCVCSWRAARYRESSYRKEQSSWRIGMWTELSR